MVIKTVSDNDKVLRTKCKKIEKVDEEIKTLMDAMERYVEESTDPKLIALSAPQVGIAKRIIVIYYNGLYYKLANPKVISKSGKQIFFEACGTANPSGKYDGGFLERAAQVEVEALNYNGEIINIMAKRVFAVALLHEIDHLEGILYTDKAIGDLITFETDQERNDYRKEHPLEITEAPK